MLMQLLPPDFELDGINAGIWYHCLPIRTHTHIHTHTTVLWPSWILSGTTQVSWHQRGKTRKENKSGFTGARDSEWQWHQLGHMQICTLPQPCQHAATHFLQSRCPSCCPTDSIKALKDISLLVRRKLYSSCLRSSMLRGIETGPVRKQNEVVLQQA